MGSPGITQHAKAARRDQGATCGAGIETPRYLIGGTGDGSCALRLFPAAPLPLRDFILLNEDHDIPAWLLANDGRNPWDLMVLESVPDPREDGTLTPEPADRRYRYFDRKV